LDFCKRSALLLQPNSVLLEIHRIYGIRLYGEIPAMARNVVLHLRRSPLVWTGKAAYRNLGKVQVLIEKQWQTQETSLNDFTRACLQIWLLTVSANN